MKERKNWLTPLGGGLAKAFGIAMIASLAAACGDAGNNDVGADGDSSAVLAPRGEEDPTVLHRGNGTEPDSLDPHRASGTWENNIIGDMFIGLYTDDPKGEAMPGAIVPGEEGHRISEDGTVHTFTLREDMTWSDGTPVTAEDFVFAMRRILDPNTAARYASLLYDIEGAREINNGRAELDTLGVRAVDARTLEITTINPLPYLPQLLTHYTTFPVPKHVVEEMGDAWVRPGNMVTNGPYVLSEWRPNNYVKLVKNDRFYDAENVAIEEVYFYPTDQADTALRRFRAGEMDMNITTAGFPSQQIDFLQRTMPEEARIYPQVASTYIVFNTTKAPFDDPEIRKAIGMLVRREILTDQILKSGQIPGYGFVPPDMANYSDGAQLDYAEMPYEERLAEAKRILEEKGFGPDNPLEFEYRYRESIDNRRAAIATQSFWKEAGIEASIVNTEPKVHYNDLESGNFTVGEAGWVADFNDPYNFLFLLDSESGSLNYARYANEEYDRLLAQAQLTLDLDERAELLERAEAIMLEDSPIVPLYYGATRNLVRQYVEGFEDNVVNIHRTRFLSIDTDATGEAEGEAETASAEG